jgi:hypothetical protein
MQRPGLASHAVLNPAGLTPSMSSVPVTQCPTLVESHYFVRARKARGVLGGTLTFFGLDAQSGVPGNSGTQSNGRVKIHRDTAYPCMATNEGRNEGGQVSN